MNSSEEEQIYSIALTMVPGIGHIGAKHLMDEAGSAGFIFHNREALLECVSGISRRVVNALDCPQAIDRAKQEFDFVQKNNIRCLTITDEEYPSRLRECEDAPVVLFFKGNTDLNALRVVNMVGTRHATDYGTRICASFLHDLKVLCPDVLVVSGLAYGIDIKGHIEDTRWQGIQTDYTNTEFYKQKLPFVEFFKSYLNYSDRISLIVFHPGYLDYDVIRTSSLTVNRCLDTALLCDAEVKEYLKQHTLLSFKEL